MKNLLRILLVATSFLPFLSLHSQKLSPQAQAVLNRLPPEQRAMALQEANRLRGQPRGELSTQSSQSNGGGPKAEIKAEVNTLDSVEKEDELLVLTELELALRADITQEKESLDEAKKELSAIEFFEVEKSYNDRLHDMETILSSIKTAKIEFLKEKIDNIQGETEDVLKPFGYDFFNKSIDELNQNTVTSIPSNYNVGPGDYLEIQLFGQQNAGYSVVIGQNGIIQFPGIGPINAFEKGGSFQNLKNLVKEKVREHLGEGVQVSVSMGEVRMIKVFLAGRFKQPGVKLLPATSTIVEALLQSGGLDEYGSLRNLTLKRKGQDDKSYDFYNLLLDGENPALDSLLEGDVILLPSVKNRVIVKGEVAQSAIYELTDSSSLKDVIQLAGGFSSYAYNSEIRLLRNSQFGNKILKSLSFESDENFIIKNGDIIEVGSTMNLSRHSIELTGEVHRAGQYEWKENMNLSDIISNKFIFTDNADLNYAVIRRLNDDGMIEVLSFSPKNLLGGSQNTSLLLRDKIIIFSKFDSDARERQIRPLLKELSFDAEPAIGTKVVSVSGEVHFPGDYPKTKRMNILDLITAAGGFKESAYSLAAEISRISLDLNKSKSEAVVEHILLDSLQNENALNIELKPGDVLSVKKIPSWEDNRVVTLSGEVRFPGEYTIKKNEKLGELFKRAGGLTKEAFSAGTVFTRTSLMTREEEQKEKLIKQLESDIATLSLSPTSGDSAQKANSVAQSLLSRLESSKSVGRLVIDLEAQLDNPETAQITLRDGDRLHIPIIPSEISIMGEVQFPTSHLHNAGFSMDQYIALSGGFTQNADEKRIFVVKSNGAVLTKKGNGWFNAGGSNKNIQPGDVIVVPINLQKGRWLETLTSSTQIVYQLAVTAAAVNSF
ncbi:MAG: hypothetical protein HN548_13445 [Opitutae bacterium]|nr:hypothetical protein [Opitutae bacterium]